MGNQNKNPNKTPQGKKTLNEKMHKNRIFLMFRKKNNFKKFSNFFFKLV
jgi:hypothetical protein